ncbi:Iron-sulfur assembly protein 1 [Steccherinum ochraceum]|uniref:Iron-sulfur assembly protein 1 n=1 Tax=Steccherinum ochraceum TaxID=92696 RepID=A0A4R0RBS5_9APHY|nr:Iron-sulfur assembly protein 1 [Steccherinum ochraceum]
MASIMPLLRARTLSTPLASSSSHYLIHLPSHRHAMMSAMSRASGSHVPLPGSNHAPTLGETPPVVIPTSKAPSAKDLSADAAAPQVAAKPPPAPKAERPRPTIRASKAAISITPVAVEHLKALMKSPTPQLLRIGVRNKGCAGLSYHLEYVDKPAKFDEVVEQDGIQVVIDSKALFSIIGSEMDWKEDTLSAKFAFKNPNVTDACGCGESFTVNS